MATTRVTHATPATTFAHVVEREWRDLLLSSQARAVGCRDIARQLLEFSYGDGLEVVLGGGRRGFLPAEEVDPADPAQHGARLHGRNLMQRWTQRFPDAVSIWRGD